MRWIMILAALCSINPLYGQSPLPVPDKSSERILSDDRDVEFDSYYKELYEQLKAARDGDEEEIKKLRKKVSDLKDKKTYEDPSPYPASKSPAEISSQLGKKSSHKRARSSQSSAGKTYRTASGLKVFAVLEDESEEETMLPAGSWVRAKLLTGVQANAKYPYNTLLQLDYAYTGPNRSKIPLNGCLMLGGATADLSIERVIIAPHTLSCVRDNGEYVERPVSGFVAGRDSSNGLEGIVDSKQSRVFLAAALSGIVKGASEAYQIANTQQALMGSENGAVATNFKGEFEKLAVSRGVGKSAEMVTSWYLEQAKSLLPTINIGSGQDVWIIMAESVAVPGLLSEEY